ncbi:MAG TPA: cytochrome b [Burkholderiales bacterium]|nr:cytochrome b [Burkholderiales bacterium]
MKPETLSAASGNGRYTAPAIALHWVIALSILGTFALGLYMHDLSLSPTKLRLYSWHKWAGVTLFLLASARLLWRVTHRPPPLPETTPPLQRLAAAGAHHLLYVLTFAVPLTGWLMSSALGFQTVWFGVLPIPDLLPKDPDLGELLKALHQNLNFLMAAVVAAHAAAAVKHHVIDRDDVLRRMLPGRVSQHPA